MKRMWKIAVLASLVIAFQVVAETDHNVRSSGPSTGESNVRAGAIANFCEMGRPSPIRLPDPVNPSPGELFEPPSDFDVEQCLEDLPEPEEKPEPCLTALGYCVAKTVDGGRTRLRTPIEVEFACINHMDELEVLQKGCKRGIDPDRFEDGDINCGGDKSEL